MRLLGRLEVGCGAVAMLVVGCSSSNTGGGSNGERPLAVIADAFRSVTAGSTVVLDATDSYDPDNAAPAFPHGIDEFHWTLVAPSSSGAAIASSTDGTASFVADVEGSFGGELVVDDQDGDESDPALFGITAEAIDPEADGLLVRVTWETNPSDFDLHVVRDGGTFYEAPLDCYYGNVNPDWGTGGDANNPILEADAVEGPGPERIRIRTPEATTYRVYVHLYSEDGTGPQSASLDIAHFGAWVASHQRAGLTADLVWEVGTVAFADSSAAPSFTFTDTTFPSPI